MTINQISKLQKEFGMEWMQERINDGSIWSFEGSMGRQAMSMLKSGECYLGSSPTRDYYGNRIPSIDEVEEGTTGSLQNAINFWSDEHNIWNLEEQLYDI